MQSKNAAISNRRAEEKTREKRRGDQATSKLGGMKSSNRVPTMIVGKIKSKSCERMESEGALDFEPGASGVSHSVCVCVCVCVCAQGKKKKEVSLLDSAHQVHRPDTQVEIIDVLRASSSILSFS